MENVLILNIDETISYIVGRPEKMGQSYRAELMLVRVHPTPLIVDFSQKPPKICGIFKKSIDIL
jgi:hypothetical protein